MVFYSVFHPNSTAKRFQISRKPSNFNRNVRNFVCGWGCAPDPVVRAHISPRPSVIRREGKGRGEGACSRFEASGPGWIMIRPGSIIVSAPTDISHLFESDYLNRPYILRRILSIGVWDRFVVIVYPYLYLRYTLMHLTHHHESGDMMYCRRPVVSSSWAL